MTDGWVNWPPFTILEMEYQQAQVRRYLAGVNHPIKEKPMSSNIKPGDLCRILEGGYVQHMKPCSIEGAITEISTGRRLSPYETAKVLTE